MTDPFERIGWKACTSALQLDRWATGELSAPEAETLRVHVADCARCAGAAETLRAAARLELPPLRAARRRPLSHPSPPRCGGEGEGEGVSPPRRPGRWPAPVALGGLVAALAAGVLLVVRLPPPVPPATGLKGSPFGVRMYVQHGGEVREVEPGGTVSPGDAVRFAITSPVKAYVAVLGLDPRGRASVYFPLGPRAEPLGPGAGAPLPIATRLDESAGEERIWALFCSAPIELEPVRARLERGEESPVPRGCEVAGWHFVKR